MNWCYTKMASWEIIVICILIHYRVENIIKIGRCWRYNEPKQCHFWAWLKRPIFGVHDSQGSAETLVRKGGITNKNLIAYSFSNISAKNYQNRLMCSEVIVYNVIVVFFETQCRCSCVYLFAPVGMRSMVIGLSVSVWLHLCLSVGPLLYLKNHTAKLYQIFCGVMLCTSGFVDDAWRHCHVFT